jgi:hypothetical protein
VHTLPVAFDLDTWFPLAQHRKAVADLVAQSIQHVHRNAPGSWEFTQRTKFARLNVGQIAVLDIFPQSIAVYGMRTRVRSSHGVARHRNWKSYNAVPGTHERWLVDADRIASLPPEIVRAHLELLSAAWTAKRRSPYKHSHTASAVDTIALLSRRPLEQPEYWSSGGAQVRNDTNIGMFGDSETNRLVEVAAVGIVRQHYEAEGWTVVSRESDKCGYDLECSRGRSRRHVEVKGRSGAEVAFVLTQRELEAAETDSLFQLAVVTLALTGTPVAQFYGKAEFAERFSLRPISYVARLAVRKDAC